MQSAHSSCLVIIAERPHPFPFRTRKLRSPAPMVLPGQPGGRVGRRQAYLQTPRQLCWRGVCRSGLGAGPARGIRPWPGSSSPPGPCVASTCVVDPGPAPRAPGPARTDPGTCVPRHQPGRARTGFGAGPPPVRALARGRRGYRTPPQGGYPSMGRSCSPERAHALETRGSLEAA